MIKFTKMQGLGNDYVYIDAIHQNIKKPSSLAKFVSNRNFGIGSDGLILICKSEVADFKMRMFNQDGSEAEMCGNGIRCVGKFVYDKGLTTKTNITVETLAGIKEVEYVRNRKGIVEEYRVNMGIPKFEGVIRLNVLNQIFYINKVNLGNPHAVIFAKDVDNININKYGPLIENNKIFPKKTNVEFVQMLSKNLIKMRVWERGSNETLACGTGACASVIAGNYQKQCGKNVKVLLKGGELYINLENNYVYMQGIATKVFDGIIEI